MNNKSLTTKDLEYILCSCRSIARLEKHDVNEQQIKQMLYQLGVYAYRQYHKVGLPADLKHPLLSAPKKVWDKTSHSFVDERELVAV
jgi:hypothetical protein